MRVDFCGGGAGDWEICRAGRHTLGDTVIKLILVDAWEKEVREVEVDKLDLDKIYDSPRKMCATSVLHSERSTLCRSNA